MRTRSTGTWRTASRGSTLSHQPAVLAAKGLGSRRSGLGVDQRVWMMLHGPISGTRRRSPRPVVGLPSRQVVVTSIMVVPWSLGQALDQLHDLRLHRRSAGRLSAMISSVWRRWRCDYDASCMPGRRPVRIGVDVFWARDADFGQQIDGVGALVHLDRSQVGADGLRRSVADLYSGSRLSSGLRRSRSAGPDADLRGRSSIACLIWIVRDVAGRIDQADDGEAGDLFAACTRPTTPSTSPWRDVEGSRR